MSGLAVIRSGLDIDRAPAEVLRAYVCDLEDALRAAVPDATHEKLDRIRMAFPGASPKVAAIIALLADGRLRNKDAILSHLYAGRVDDEPLVKIVDVFICKARAALAGSTIVIETAWGQGYRLLDPERHLRRLLDEGARPPIDPARSRVAMRATTPPRPKPAPAKRGAPVRPDRVTQVHRLVIEVAARAAFTGIAVDMVFTCAGSVPSLVDQAEKRGWIVVHSRAKRGGNHGRGRRPWTVELTKAGNAELRRLRDAGVRV